MPASRFPSGNFWSFIKKGKHKHAKAGSTRQNRLQVLPLEKQRRNKVRKAAWGNAAFSMSGNVFIQAKEGAVQAIRNFFGNTVLAKGSISTCAESIDTIGWEGYNKFILDKLKR